MSFSFQVIIPARFASTRLPGKLLETISNKPLVQHAYESALGSGARQVLIATDDERIQVAAGAFGARVIMTSPEHESGTDRLAEVIGQLGLPDDDIIVNLQADEFGLPAVLVDQVAGAVHDNPGHAMATLCEKITSREDLDNPHIVKVVFDRDNTAIYFSRSIIPWTDRNDMVLPYRPWRHIGLYAYRAGFLREYASLTRCPLEETEKLEQLRALYYGYRIHIQEAVSPCGIGIDTAEDLERARNS